MSSSFPTDRPTGGIFPSAPPPPPIPPMADHRGGDYSADDDDEGGTAFHFRGDGRPSRRVRGRPGWAAAAAAAAALALGGGGGGGGDGDGDGNGDGNGNHSTRVREAGGIGGQGDSGGVGVGTLALPGLLGLRGLTRIWGRPPPPNLTDHILREDWALAAMECRMRPRSAAQWTTQGGFLHGETFRIGPAPASGGRPPSSSPPPPDPRSGPSGRNPPGREGWRLRSPPSPHRG